MIRLTLTSLTSLALSVSVMLVVFCSTAARSGEPTTSSKLNPMTVPRNMNEAMRASVVQVLVRPAGTMGRAQPIGSGFLIGDGGHVATAYHVIENFQDDSKFELVIGLPQNTMLSARIRIRGTFIIDPAVKAAVDPGNDVALLKLSHNPLDDPPPPLMQYGEEKIQGSSPKPAVMQLERPDGGEAVAILGYPLSIPVMVTNRGWIAANDYYESDPTDPSSTGDRYLVDANVNRGNSGGPVFSELNGKVIGVCVAYRNASVRQGENDTPLTYNSGLAVTVPASAVIDLMRKHKIPES